MHFEELSADSKEQYKEMLTAIGSLSKLFSQKETPYIEYRIGENLYCKAFNAKNVSRDDSAIDAVNETTGIGIKTFQGSSSQKISEFNKDRMLFSSLSPEKMMLKISELRNERLEFAKRNYHISDLIYHCILRTKGRIQITEYPMDSINIEKIKILNVKDNAIAFTDGIHEYSFNISKSVLMMKFEEGRVLMEMDVEILDDPIKALEGKMAKIIKETSEMKVLPEVVLPLYSPKSNPKKVQEKSGLNQWNAVPRKKPDGTSTPRHPDEVYIPVPAWIHKKFAGFFPPKDKMFKLMLPNGNFVKASMCQQNNKALMSDPNRALGEWILRDILRARRGALITYERLKKLGIDSATVKKISDEEYTIDFASEGSYENFERANN